MKLSIITATYNRPKILQDNALPSILAQTINPQQVEWIVINDGNHPKTAHIIESLDAEFDIVHHPIPHPQTGFGLCHARNQGLAIASGDIVAYLDDDNALHSTFALKTIDFFEQHPEINYSMTRQQRRRDSLHKQGTAFVEPSEECSVDNLIRQDQLFDSNGFAHRTDNPPQWNPNYRIFCDYHYFLQCINHWGPETFRLNPSILVDYVQSPNGIIGQSQFEEWATELLDIIQETTLTSAIATHIPHLQALAQHWQQNSNPAPAFV
ncbi:glycosyltransferase family A protein [Okeania sp. SIO2G5]|uniref:glycosyltransferase family 2 protein n=1 Tax=Okeania sp. SIO2G5 TaxID=2607796 RepID=UPI0013BF1BF8|nr:glycosyltransferase family A protein [Okeania sp. SIO2G5]NEP76174.1 glycosyltransferase family 2 protein [Okeania sp. SIO2G5]